MLFQFTSVTSPKYELLRSLLLLEVVDRMILSHSRLMAKLCFLALAEWWLQDMVF